MLAGNVTVMAPTLTLAAGLDSLTSYAFHSEKFAGLNLSVEAGGNNPLSAVQNGANYLNAANRTRDPQAKLLYEAATGVQAAQGALNVYNALGTEGGLTQALTTASIKFGVGVSVSTSESSSTMQQASGGYILAAGNLGLYATAGDLTLKGANVSAYNVTMSAQRDLVMQSLALTDTSYSKSSSYSAFVELAANVSYGASGFSASYGINVSASDATSQSQSVAVNHAQTAVNGTGFVLLTSGRDTNLYGAYGFGRRHRGAGGPQPQHRQRPGHRNAKRRADLLELQRHGRLRFGVAFGRATPRATPMATTPRLPPPRGCSRAATAMR